MPRSTKRRPKSGMTKGSSRKISNQEIRYYSLIPRHGKLRSKWEGPYSVVEAAPHRAIILQDDDGKIFKVNGRRLKIFLEPDNKEYDVIDFIEEA